MSRSENSYDDDDNDYDSDGYNRDGYDRDGFVRHSYALNREDNENVQEPLIVNLSNDQGTSLKFSDIDLSSLIEEFKESSENENIVGSTIREQKEMLKNKIYCFIVQKLSNEYNIREIKELEDLIISNIDQYINGSYQDIIEGKYQKKYLKYKNKYLKLKNKFISSNI